MPDDENYIGKKVKIEIKIPRKYNVLNVIKNNKTQMFENKLKVDVKNDFGELDTTVIIYSIFQYAKLIIVSNRCYPNYIRCSGIFRFFRLVSKTNNLFCV